MPDRVRCGDYVDDRCPYPRLRKNQIIGRNDPHQYAVDDREAE